MATEAGSAAEQARAKKMREMVTRDEIGEAEAKARSALGGVKDAGEDAADRLTDAVRGARKGATGAGRKERVAGKVMQWEGEATGDPVRKTEGKALTAYGRLKGAAHKARKRSN